MSSLSNYTCIRFAEPPHIVCDPVFERLNAFCGIDEERVVFINNKPRKRESVDVVSSYVATAHSRSVETQIFIDSVKIKQRNSIHANEMKNVSRTAQICLDLGRTARHVYDSSIDGSYHRLQSCLAASFFLQHAASNAANAAESGVQWAFGLAFSRPPARLVEFCREKCLSTYVCMYLRTYECMYICIRWSRVTVRRE